MQARIKETEYNYVGSYSRPCWHLELYHSLLQSLPNLPERIWPQDVVARLAGLRMVTLHWERLCTEESAKIQEHISGQISTFIAQFGHGSGDGLGKKVLRHGDGFE